MVDREKVIKGLKYCKEYFSCCDKCPYWHSGTQCVTDLANDAFDLLKEQEPVKPIERSGFWYCGNCRYALMTNHQKFCSDCGQAVKWE